jgi:hypothetical protein
MNGWMEMDVYINNCSSEMDRYAGERTCSGWSISYPCSEAIVAAAATNKERIQWIIIAIVI